MLNTKFTINNKGSKGAHKVYLVDKSIKLDKIGLTPEQVKIVVADFKMGVNPSYTRLGGAYIYIIQLEISDNQSSDNEKNRKLGSQLTELANKSKLDKLHLINTLKQTNAASSLIEGLLLSNYQFNKYITKEVKDRTNSLKEISVEGIDKKEITEISTIVEATCIARDLVNEPLSYLTAEKLSEEIKKLGKETGFSVEVFNKSKIKSLKMGGLLAVNIGSPNPPTFSILEWKPKKAKNKKPLVLVGKGVVYDTGGLSLKPTPNSMDSMKSDMGGAAAVVGAIYAISKNKLPYHVIGLIPATENRPGGNAYVPGDVIKMHNGMSVEVLNTDAEGRMILADALSFADKYKPELVIDLATLTGAAMRAIGAEGVVLMGNAPTETKQKMIDSGNKTHERLVEFPLWEEYGIQIKSDIADIKNLGGPSAGAITAGKFLEHFTNYNWLHIDIAGMAWLQKSDSYRLKNGTGVGVRLLYNFIKQGV